jgi:hypothetical protein
LTDLKIPIARLLERRSKTSGKSYLTGRLGDARVLIFRETDIPKEELCGADAAWQVFVATGDQGYSQRVERRERLSLAAARPFRREDR